MRSDPRYVRLAAVAMFALVLAVLGAGLAGVALSDPDRAVALAKPVTVKGEPQETPLDAYQTLPYGAAIVVCLAMAMRSRRDRRPLWIGLLAVAAWLLWRELPYDEQWLGANTFSWAKYLGNPDVPMVRQVLAGGLSMAFAVGLVAYVLLRRREVGRLLREKLFSVSSWLFVATAAVLVAAQMVDKHRTTDELLATGLSEWALKDYLEESLELVGATLLLLTCIMAAVEQIVPLRPTVAAVPPAQEKGGGEGESSEG